MIWLIILIFFLYLISILILEKGFKRHVSIRESGTPSISIIIPARNEEMNLASCLESIAELDYPAEKHEIILISDRSEDSTGEIMRKFCTSHTNAYYTEINEKPAGITGKANALIKGTEKAKGEYLFFTDSDCVVSVKWIKTMLQYFTKNTGLTAAGVLINNDMNKKSLFVKLQEIDWIMFSLTGSASSGLGKPLSIFGNNFAVRKQTLDESGGFKAAAAHITEDYAVMRNILDQTGWKIKFPFTPENTVKTAPLTNLNQWYNQRKRWAAGAKDRSFLSAFFLGQSFLMNSAVLSAFIFNPVSGILLLTAVTAADVYYLYSLLKQIKKLYLIFFLPVHHLYTFMMQLCLIPAFLFSGKVRWKGNTYLQTGE